MMRHKFSIILLGAMIFSMSAEAQGGESRKKDLIGKSGLSSAQQKDSITCHIIGNVIDRPETTSAMIVEADKDFRIHRYITVPVTDGKFSYTLKDTIPMAYNVYFDDEIKQGSMRIRHFFSGNGDIELFYHDNDHADDDTMVSDIQDNILAENFLTKEKSEILNKANRFYAVIDSLFEHKGVYSKDAQALYDRLESLPQGHEKDSIMDVWGRLYKQSREDSYAHSRFYSEEYLESEKALKELYFKGDLMKRNLISDNPSLFGLYSIKYAILGANYGGDWIDIPAYEDIFETVYKARFPSHPYTEEISGLLEARNVKAGNRYPDFKVTREDGTTERISSLIKDNVAVIDLWASWCGPCRRHSKELIPLYEKYKDNGFKIIAIARESDNCLAMNYAMEQDGYPWESFVDLNDRDKVWRINRAGNSGGKIILVNSDGTIVGTDMPIQDIKTFLENTYDK